MQSGELKLKQASAVLGVAPKDLQNLIQLKVLRPMRRDNLYWFDAALLLEAKLAFYLKESLGASSKALARFTNALSRNLREQETLKTRYLWLRPMPGSGQAPIELRIPLRDLAKELEERLPMASVYRDLPRGRKRPGWKREFQRNIEAAAGDLSGIGRAEISEAIRGYRTGKKCLAETGVGGAKKRA